ncbi:tRNA (adenosine(37)-N6)-threonylcarbamoyltransferase complex ATPase subunit type 1 TsaE [Vulcanibacillus modesticaldus]|uniref:tRNA threonylcarbamoyladenosine biosynthesis protein TsaE n=1 Tax=Vulcanibacillus modesticaldus TaxID=337097 RepID=A0A1D2YX67_9BACI|nr:tRNA (adenosine(37)-N6)-threonylcarbamoyltransferase complex ATPase subunit type 1 TsaE [Vulcanibacillus modesticaldus]OEG00256.1 tRNA (adenosine(37)-N6)-threonylcarbamoyltransferase complex ATPase subunit type 1 TsaE [Vulcanibacillus modesticaldus]
MVNSYQFTANNVSETRQLASKLANYLKPGNVLTLEGGLGAGKTAFTQGLAIGLGITQIVNSPTFTIIKEYHGKYPLYHMDVYRLEDGYDDIGFEDYFYGDGITVIEWASIIKDILPKQYLNIRIEKSDDNKRRIFFEPNGDEYIQICEEFMANEYFGD